MIAKCPENRILWCSIVHFTFWMFSFFNFVNNLEKNEWFVTAGQIIIKNVIETLWLTPVYVMMHQCKGGKQTIFRIHVCACAGVYACLCVCVHVCTCVCMCVHVCACACKQASKQASKQTNKQTSKQTSKPVSK